MDTFDTILDQLKRTQGRGLDSVRNRLEFAIENLSEVLTEATTSIREAIPEDAEELIPVAEIEKTIADLKSEVESERAERERLEKQIEAGDGGPAPAESPAGGISFALLQRLDQARSQSELLRALLPVLCESVDRAAVLVIRDGEVSAWSGIGFADGERLRNWRAPVAESPALSALVEHQATVIVMPGDDPVLATWLDGETAPSHAMIAPVVLRGRLMGGIYADDVRSGSWNPDTARTLIALACWMIDTLHARGEGGSAMLRDPIAIGEGGPRDDEVPDADRPSAPEVPAAPEPPVAPEPEPESESEQEPEPEPEPEPVPAPEPESAPVSAPSFDPSATMRVEVAPEMFEQPGGPAEAVPVDEEPAEVPQVVEEPPAAEPVAEAPPPEEATASPPPQAPVQPPAEPESSPGEPGPLSPDQEARHEEARRFARLLVSEIKLYNETEVEQGRAAGNLYERLKEDIDRSREMYEKRIDEEIRGARDYFQDELIRVLADGDPDALGM